MTDTASIWTNHTPAVRYPRIEADLEVDVAIVGGGLTGVTAALLLADSGKRVAILEGRRIGSGVTQRSTAHVTEAIDTRYVELERRDHDLARVVRESSRAAMDWIARLAQYCPGQAGFRRVPGYLFSEDPDQSAALRDEAAAAQRAGARVEVGEVPLSIATGVGVRFENQAELDPVAYVDGLTQRAARCSALVFEESLVVGLSTGDRMVLELEHGPTVTATDVILATHSPFTKATFQTKISQYRSYVVAGSLEKPLDALYWDTADPYHYVRSARLGDGNPASQKSYLIVGGEDHKTGHEPEGGTQGSFHRLSEYLRRLGLEPSLFWSAQVVESVDGLPYIGKPTGSERVHVATGFGGNGTTFGTLAALILCDDLLGKENPYAHTYRATRFATTSLPPLVKENVDFPLQLLRDRLQGSSPRSAAELATGEGAVLQVDGEKLAVYRDDSGRLHAVSALCTHMGCQVAFNPSERSWDCPCHGSRFGIDGAVLDGPANKRLAKRLL